MRGVPGPDVFKKDPGFIACPGFIPTTGGVASLVITEGESKVELDGSSLPLLVLEG